MSARKPVVFISSTARDLPEYREKAIAACRQAGFDTLEMELFAADDRSALQLCKAKVEESDIYLGIYAFRYGTVPEGEDRSITEMEYDWASALGLPRLLFLMDPEHPWPRAKCDTNLARVEAFRERVSGPKAHCGGKFTSEADLAAKIFPALQTVEIRPEKVRKDHGEVAIRSYLQRLDREAGEIGMFGLGQDIQLVLPISEVYVDLQLQAIHAMGTVDAEGREDFEALSRADRREDLPWDEVMKTTFSRSAKTRKRAVCILGEPGAGKTTVAKKIAWELASGTRSSEEFGLEPETIPVLLRFRDLRAEEITAAGTNLLRYWVVTKTTDALGESPGEAIFARGKVLWILDGLDEVVSGRMRHDILQYLQGAIEARFDKGDRFLLTSRFSGVGGEAKLPAVFQEFHVKALPWEQVEIFVNRWFATAMEALSLGRIVAKEKSTGLLDILAQDEYRVGRLRALCYNPLMLTILCVVFHRNAQLPHSRAELYSHCVDVLLSYWKRSSFDSTKCRALLRLIAWHLHGEDDRTHAPRTELAALLESRLKEFNDPRLGANGEEFLTQMRNDCGILAGAGGGNLGFLHLTFQEFLASEHALREGKVAFVAERAAVKWWREAVLLTARQASQVEAETFYRTLLARDLNDQNVMRIVSLCFEESIEFPAAPILEQIDSRDETGRTRLLQCLQSRPRLPDPVLDALEELVRATASGTELFNLVATLLARQGRGLEEAVDNSFWTEPVTGMVFRWIPPGSFIMGDATWSHSPPHPVTLSTGFWMSVHPVTNGQYAVHLKGNDVKPPEFWNDSQWNGERQPVVGVDWSEASAFAQWMGGSLPTEAQWEYACRAGSTTKYGFGDDPALLPEYAWFKGNSEGRTHDVGSLKPNDWGLHDMHGNVWEWCADWSGDYAKEAVTDSTGPSQGVARVLRGGCWGNVASGCASGYRFGLPLRRPPVQPVPGLRFPDCSAPESGQPE